MSAGPLWAVGNTLVITTPKDNGGIATMDISDPLTPRVLDFIAPSKSYICGLYGKHVYVQSPLRVVGRAERSHRHRLATRPTPRCPTRRLPPRATRPRPST